MQNQANFGYWNESLWSANCKSAPAAAIQMLQKISWQLNELELEIGEIPVWYCVDIEWVHWSCRICIKDDITKLSLELELYLWASHHRILANHKRIFESQFYCDWSSCPGIIWTHNNFQRYLQIYINRQFWQSSSITVRASNIFKVKSRHHNATFTTKFVEQTEPHRIFCISMLVAPI